MKDRRIYIIHIRECIARIKEYTSGGKQQYLKVTVEAIAQEFWNG